MREDNEHVRSKNVKKPTDFAVLFLVLGELKCKSNACLLQFWRRIFYLSYIPHRVAWKLSIINNLDKRSIKLSSKPFFLTIKSINKIKIGMKILPSLENYRD